ncbi:CoA transferase [Puniceibacterium sp. IMCC21224]|uniref:CoA transferase n=1 Tax=Puniceibacterium sp. IMCC21224 TaxID=1618204 RepID=UPI00064DFD5B|nr:CoA transferase [Puniceibacterium sp. IMCC21224]KMK65064.1 putative acyl-CoA transferase/carnitine dehydratase [Puniceibacterium sp. IMCC21224]
MPTPKPLTGRRVIEFTQFIAGPTAGQLLADFGAEVIKLEPARGDGSRELPGTEFGSAYFRCFNTSKSSLVVDMGSEEGRAQFEALLTEADALLCNLAPGTLRKLGLDGDSLRRRHPHLVVTLISGFGQQDDRTCMDTIAQCESGFAWMNGNLDGTPRVSSSWPVDFYSGLYASYATAMALMDPATKGTVIDLTMLEVASAMLLGPAAILLMEGAQIGPPSGNRDRASAPSGVYPCDDGHVYIYGGLDAYWARLRPIVGGEDAPKAERLARADDFDLMIENWTRQHSVEHVLAQLGPSGIPSGAVRKPADGIARIQALRPGGGAEALSTGEHVPSFPALFDGARIARAPAPLLGSTIPGFQQGSS